MLPVKWRTETASPMFWCAYFSMTAAGQLQYLVLWQGSASPLAPKFNTLLYRQCLINVVFDPFYYQARRLKRITGTAAFFWAIFCGDGVQGKSLTSLTLFMIICDTKQTWRTSSAFSSICGPVYSKFSLSGSDAAESFVPASSTSLLELFQKTQFLIHSGNEGAKNKCIDQIFYE